MHQEFVIQVSPKRPRRPKAQGAAAATRQLIVGLLALPLSVVPFVAYVTGTPEGRLVADKARVSISPPTVPQLSAAEKTTIAKFKPTYEGSVMVLAYHGIGSSSDGEGGFVVSPHRFGQHLAALKAAGMNTVTADDVAEAFDGGKALPRNALLLTFDDGRTDAMMFADPLLEAAGMKATMFTISGAAARPGVYYASWDRIQKYASSRRWDIQSHTDTLHREHPVAKGGTLPALTSLAVGESLTEYRKRIRRDLSAASDAIREKTGHSPVAFAYPFGAYGAERTNHPQIRNILRQEVSSLYKLAFHQDEQESIPLASTQHDLLGLRRLEVEDWSPVRLIREVSASALRPGSTPNNPLLLVEAPDAASEPSPGALAGQAPPPATPTPEQPVGPKLETPSVRRLIPVGPGIPTLPLPGVMVPAVPKLIPDTKAPALPFLVPPPSTSDVSDLLNANLGTP